MLGFLIHATVKEIKIYNFINNTIRGIILPKICMFWN